MTEGARQIEMSRISQIWDWERFASPLEHVQQEEIRWIERGLRDVWQLGQNVIIAWAITDGGIDLLSVPYFDMPGLMESSSVGESRRTPLSCRPILEGFRRKRWKTFNGRSTAGHSIFDSSAIQPVNSNCPCSNSSYVGT